MVAQLPAGAGTLERARHHDHKAAARPRQLVRAYSRRWRRRSPRGTRIRRSCRYSACDTIRMSATRSWRSLATDNGLLAPELVAGIGRGKSAKSIGVRAGNWLSLKQVQALLNAPGIATAKGLRDRAIIAVLLGRGLRRCDVAALTDGRCSGGSTQGGDGRRMAREYGRGIV